MWAVVQSDNNATHACADAAWQKLSQVNSGASFTASLWRAAEGAAAPTFTWTGSVPCAARIAYYADGSNVTEAAPGNSTSNSGATSTHSTSSIASTRDNSLFVYFDAANANTALAQPAGWTENEDNGSATDGGRIAFGSKAAPTSGTNSGAISIAGANAEWVQWQVELRVQLATGFQASKEAIAAWIEPVAGFASSKVDFYAWIEPGTYPAPNTRRRPLIVN
jgi:hypothetical protein